MRISLEQARQLIAERVQTLPPVSLPLSAAPGRLVQEDLCAPITQPPFPRSPLDGYALRAADSTGASPETPVTLRVIDRSFAGVPAKKVPGIGEAVRIMTGALIPEGADCVIRQEDTDCGEEAVRIYTPLRPYNNYCFAGEDYRQGECLVPAGYRMDAGGCALLAGAGIRQIPVNTLPRVAIISTGSELQRPDAPLDPGKIYDANSAYLQARLRELSIPQISLYQAGDNLEALKETFSAALAAHDLVISTGGVSVGQADLVPPVLEALGGQKHFHGVDIKPGMPAAFFTVQGKSVLALSGNPFACVVTFELLGRAVLGALSGDSAIAPSAETALLQETHEKARPVRRFCCGRLENGSVSFSEAQQNGKTRMLIGCDCLVELPAGNDVLAAGTPVQVYRL